MSDSGVTPNTCALTALLRIYSKHKLTQDAMKDNNSPTNRVLYNTLLTMCMDLEMDSEAERIFDEAVLLEKQG